MKNPLKATLVSACIATAFASAAVLAQAPAAPQGRAVQGTQEQRPFTKPTERVEARLAYQKTALKITPAQEAQWNRYADFSRRQARDMEQRFDKMRQDMQARSADGAKGREPRQRPNAIEQLERRQAFMAEASKHLNDRIAVQKPLYAALSPEQQKVADQVLNPRGGRGGMGHGGKGGQGGRGDHGGRGHHGHMMRG